jgi:Group 4 capsule polysaccharide lipoprotein gfcB, YjbF
MANLPAMVRGLTASGANLPLTRAEIEKIPYASIAVRLGDGNQALLILRRYAGSELVWAAANAKVLVTRHGRIVKTYGFAQDLATTIPYDPDPVDDFARYHQGDLYRRAIDLNPGHVDGVLVTSKFTRVGPQTIDILGFPHHTILWKETGSSDLLHWRFTNYFWVDTRTGYVWKSVQSPVPTLPKYEIITYRPAAHA